MMKKTIAVILLCFVVFSLFGTVYDIYLISTAPDSYVAIYGLNENSLHWQFKSHGNFVIWQVFVSCLHIALIGMSILIIRNPGSSIRFFYYIVLGGFLLWYLRYYYLWYKSGFDHYPGFDPYLF